MKFPVITTEGQEGKVLEMNADQEVVTLHSATGELLGALSWGAVIEQILAQRRRREIRPCALSSESPARREGSLHDPGRQTVRQLNRRHRCRRTCSSKAAPRWLLEPSYPSSLHCPIVLGRNTRPWRRSPGPVTSLNGICSSPEWASNLPTSMKRPAKSLSNSLTR